MPAAKSYKKSIEDARKAIAVPKPTRKDQSELFFALHQLLGNLDEIAKNRKSVETLLAFTPEIEAYRGQGSQMAADQVARLIHHLTYPVKERLYPSESAPDLFAGEVVVPTTGTDVIECLGLLADYAFSRTQGPPVRSRHAGELRAIAWKTLKSIAEVLRRPEDLAQALKVAAERRASLEERIAAVEFLSAYWRHEDPDDATVSLLSELEKDPPDRGFLVSVRQAQINLGLGDELSALSMVDYWDDDGEEE